MNVSQDDILSFTRLCLSASLSLWSYSKPVRLVHGQQPQQVSDVSTEFPVRCQHQQLHPTLSDRLPSGHLGSMAPFE